MRAALALLLCAAPCAAQNFTVGSRVHVTAPVYARTDTLGVGTKVLRTTGDKGTITGGPAGASTVYGVSWFIHYDTPPDGWSTAQYLALDAAPVPVAVASVVVTPAFDTLLVGQTVQLTATALSATGAVLTGRAVTWSPIGGQLVSVSATGLVTANMPGLGGALATSEGKQGENRTLVLASPPPPPPPPPPSTTVLPRVTALTMLAPSIGFTVGNSVGLSALPVDSAGDLLGNVVTWTVADSSVVTVQRFVSAASQAVQMVARAPGTTTVTASVGPVRATTTVNVVAPDTTAVTWSAGGIQAPNLPSLRHFTLPIVLTLWSHPCYIVNFTAPGRDSVVATTTACIHAP